MTHYKILFLLLVLFTACAQHQDDIDQVHQLIAEAEQKYEAEEYDMAFALLDSAYAYSESLNYPAGQAEALLDKSYLYDMLGKLDSGAICLKRGLEVYPDAPDTLLALFYNELISNNINTGNSQKAVELAPSALALNRRYGNAEEFAAFCGNVGIAYRRLGQIDSAAVYYQRGLEVAIQAEDYANQAFLANNLSVLYAQDRRLEESIRYAEKAMDAAAKANDDVERVSALANKGTALFYEKHNDEAIDVLTRAFEKADSLNHIYLKVKIIHYILGVLEETPDAADVAYYLQRGEELAALLPPENDNALGILESKANILLRQERFLESLQTLERLESMSRSYSAKPAHLIWKARCLAGLGRYKDAYMLQSESIEAKDSIQNEESKAKLDELTTNYRVMEKELEVAQLNEKQALSQRRISRLIAVLAVLLAIIAVLLLWIRQRRQRAQIQEAQRYIDGIEQERTRFAHELHDGACNELLAMGIQLRADQPDIPEVCKQISALRTTLRHLSHELMPPQFNQGVLLNEALAYYLSHIEKPVVNFKAEGTGWEKIPNNTSYQLYRIVQEAIGNIIVHQSDATADVSLMNNDGALKLFVTSTGEVRQGDGKGIGMQSMRDRVNSIGGTLTTEQKNDCWSLKVTL